MQPLHKPAKNEMLPPSWMWFFGTTSITKLTGWVGLLPWAPSEDIWWD